METEVEFRSEGHVMMVADNTNKLKGAGDA